ncbi:hypothetical protein C8R44DRAFT_754744 [Mycena epipterygia]|nr:hypothetical protein C8R44DRAFT_754744 [Mycena epipterygia]
MSVIAGEVPIRVSVRHDLTTILPSPMLATYRAPSAVQLLSSRAPRRRPRRPRRRPRRVHPPWPARKECADAPAGIAALAPSHLPTTLPRSHLPQHLTVSVRAPSAPAAARPHIPRTRSRSRRVHAVVLAAYYATLPRRSRPAPAHSHSSVSLPVLPFALPSP